MTRIPATLDRRSLLTRVCTVALAVGLLAGCGEVGESGSLLGGRTRLAPLSADPPAGHVTVQMLPFTGLPVTTADSIYGRFRTKAREAGIELVDRLEEPATYRVQGHFVALGSETMTTVVFTWEIFDAKGERVHRTVGQEVARSSDGDPWGAVDTDAETRLAIRAVRIIKAWLTRAAP